MHEFHIDMDALGCLRPSLEPRATEFVPAMIDTIQRIIQHGHAYAVDGGDVFFDVTSLPGYGRLSGRQQVCAWCVCGVCVVEVLYGWCPVLLLHAACTQHCIAVL